MNQEPFSFPEQSESGTTFVPDENDLAEIDTLGSMLRLTATDNDQILLQEYERLLDLVRLVPRLKLILDMFENSSSPVKDLQTRIRDHLLSAKLGLDEASAYVGTKNREILKAVAEGMLAANRDDGDNLKFVLRDLDAFRTRLESERL